MERRHKGICLELEAKAGMELWVACLLAVTSVTACSARKKGKPQLQAQHCTHAAGCATAVSRRCRHLSRQTALGVLLVSLCGAPHKGYEGGSWPREAMLACSA